YILDTSGLLLKEYEKGKNILFEGAQGTLLDVDFGTYPYVTSSNPISGSASTGTGFPVSLIKNVIGVIKSYSTRVGLGPFPTEIKGKVALILREKGKEYGATTGRPRRIGWFDAVSVRKAVEINGVKFVALTKIDVLTGLKEIKICVGYKYRNKFLNHWPLSRKIQKHIKPVYKTLPGWSEPVKGLQNFEKFPRNVKRFVKEIEKEIKAKVVLISNGRDRKDTVFIKRNFLKKIK
ncbi:MAG: adenylosuccinate synthase, partial [Caldiserica bacterium]